MKKGKWIGRAAGLLCLLACGACAPDARDFMNISGYDADGARTGSYIPSAGTMTPY
jgi:hypothetical protein